MICFLHFSVFLFHLFKFHAFVHESNMRNYTPSFLMKENECTNSIVWWWIEELLCRNIYCLWANMTECWQFLWDAQLFVCGIVNSISMSMLICTVCSRLNVHVHKCTPTDCKVKCDFAHMIHFKWKQKQQIHCKRCVRERAGKMIRNIYSLRVMWFSMLETLNILSSFCEHENCLKQNQEKTFVKRNRFHCVLPNTCGSVLYNMITKAN